MREREKEGGRERGIRGTDWYLGNRSCRESLPNAGENHGTNEIQPRIGPSVSSIPMIFRPSLRVWLKIRQAIAISTRERFWLECEEPGIVIRIGDNRGASSKLDSFSLTYYVLFFLSSLFPPFFFRLIFVFKFEDGTGVIIFFFLFFLFIQEINFVSEHMSKFIWQIRNWKIKFWSIRGGLVKLNTMMTRMIMQITNNLLAKYVIIIRYLHKL